jgi:hypothetical protein
MFPSRGLAVGRARCGFLDVSGDECAVAPIPLLLL